MKSLAVALVLILVALVTVAIAFPAQAQNPPYSERAPWLAGSRFTLAAGLGQQYEADNTHSLTNTVPRNVAWAAADYEITPAFAVTASWKRSVNGTRFDQGFVGVGFRLPFGGWSR